MVHLGEVVKVKVFVIVVVSRRVETDRVFLIDRHSVIARTFDKYCSVTIRGDGIFSSHIVYLGVLG